MGEEMDARMRSQITHGIAHTGNMRTQHWIGGPAPVKSTMPNSELLVILTGY